MNKLYIPEAINNFNVYLGGNSLVGITGEVSLVELNAVVESISGAGIAGTYEIPILGHYASMTQDIPFRALYDDVFSMADPSKMQDITLRGALQVTDKSTYGIDSVGCRFVFRGRAKNFNPGTMKAGGAMNASVTLEVMYLLYELDGEKKVELDKLNNIFRVGGTDLMEKIRKQC